MGRQIFQPLAPRRAMITANVRQSGGSRSVRKKLVRAVWACVARRFFVGERRY